MKVKLILPLGMAPATLEAGYRRAYRSFYSWPNLFRGSRNHKSWQRGARHLAYAAAWKRRCGIWSSGHVA